MTKSVFSDRYRHFVMVLRQARLDSGLTQIELAQRLGKPQSFVSKAETGERRVDVIEFLQISQALERDPVELILQIAPDYD